MFEKIVSFRVSVCLFVCPVRPLTSGGVLAPFMQLLVDFGAFRKGFRGVQKRIQKIRTKSKLFIFGAQAILENVTLKSTLSIVFDVQTLLGHGGESGQISDLQKS